MSQTGHQPDNEFASLFEVADELGLAHAAIPVVTRHSVTLAKDQRVSMVRWSDVEPELVFIHGGGQNARTWDLVALLLGRPAIAIELPGHGHSTWRSDRDYGAVRNAEAVSAALDQVGAEPTAVVGMSLGGLTLVHLARTRPDLVHRAVLVDVTPGTREAVGLMTRDQRGTTALTGGARRFDSLAEMVDAAAQLSPRRPHSAVRRGVLHNAVELPDGGWGWRYDVSDRGSESWLREGPLLWDDLAAVTAPAMLVTGGDSGFVTSDDLAEVIRRLPGIRVETVAGAGHAIQSDQPRALSDLIADFVFGHQLSDAHRWRREE